MLLIVSVKGVKEFPHRDISPSSLTSASSLEIEDIYQAKIMGKDIAQIYA
jgi:hypothetical protein